MYKGKNDYMAISYFEEQLVIINNLIEKDKPISHRKKEEGKIKNKNDFNTIETKCNFIEEDNEKINPTFEEALNILRDDWRMISRIRNPSEELQNFAVNINSMAIDYIKDPCESALNNPHVKRYLENKVAQSSRLDLPEFEDDEIRGWW